MVNLGTSLEMVTLLMATSYWETCFRVYDGMDLQLAMDFRLKRTEILFVFSSEIYFCKVKHEWRSHDDDYACMNAVRCGRKTPIKDKRNCT